MGQLLQIGDRTFTVQYALEGGRAAKRGKSVGFGVVVQVQPTAVPHR
jgi:hypothetical protein